MLPPDERGRDTTAKQQINFNSNEIKVISNLAVRIEQRSLRARFAKSVAHDVYRRAT
jgi:hypothetical protein